MIGREKKHDSASYYRHALRCDNQAGRSPPGAGDRSGTYEPGFRRSKEYYREKLDSIDQEMNVAEYGCRELPYMDEAHREIIR